MRRVDETEGHRRGEHDETIRVAAVPDVLMWTLAGVTVTCAVANIAVAVADWGRAPFVMANSAEVGVAVGAIPYLAALKMAGALGLLVGFVLTPWLGLAAAVG